MRIQFAAALSLVVLIMSSFVSGQVVATGKQHIESDTAEGQFIGFTCIVDDHLFAGGIRIRSLVYEMKIDGKNADDAKLFYAVDDLKLASDKFEYAYKPEGATEVQEGKTELSGIDFSSGHIRLTLGKLPFADAGKKYELTLTDPFKGMMVEDKKPATQPSTQPTGGRAKGSGVDLENKSAPIASPTSTRN